MLSFAMLIVARVLMLVRFRLGLHFLYYRGPDGSSAELKAALVSGRRRKRWPAGRR